MTKETIFFVSRSRGSCPGGFRMPSSSCCLSSSEAFCAGETSPSSCCAPGALRPSSTPSESARSVRNWTKIVVRSHSRSPRRASFLGRRELLGGEAVTGRRGTTSLPTGSCWISSDDLSSDENLLTSRGRSHAEVLRYSNLSWGIRRYHKTDTESRNGEETQIRRARTHETPRRRTRARLRTPNLRHAP